MTATRKGAAPAKQIVIRGGSWKDDPEAHEEKNGCHRKADSECEPSPSAGPPPLPKTWPRRCWR